MAVLQPGSVNESGGAAFVADEVVIVVGPRMGW